MAKGNSTSNDDTTAGSLVIISKAGGPASRPDEMIPDPGAEFPTTMEPTIDNQLTGLHYTEPELADNPLPDSGAWVG
jgi:hypothetical protein